MHRSTGKIVVITHAQDIRIRKLVVEQRISKGSVSIVSRPRLRLCRDTQATCHQQKKE